MILKKYIIKNFLESFNYIEYGSIHIIMPDGKNYYYAGKKDGINTSIVIYNNEAIIALAKKGDIGFAEGYRDRLWDCDNLIDLLTFSLQNEYALDSYIYGSMFARFFSRLKYIFMLNTIQGSKKNIHAHYDLGNNFYSLWLDSSMTYSSAIFNSKSDELMKAQYRKYDRIIEKLHTSGKTLEIGCGWGGFAERALLTKDYDMKGLTISKQQCMYAQKRLQNKARIALEDYRIQKGKYNNIVSIEMFEAVGERFWSVYFAKIQSLLAKKGKAVIQTITIKDSYFERYKKGGDVIRTFIFPGGMLPSFERFSLVSAKAGLTISDTFSFGKDYVYTLSHWLTRFDNQKENIKKLGFDEKFIRMWRFYLAGCAASFAVERTNVMQIELQHAR